MSGFFVHTIFLLIFTLHYTVLSFHDIEEVRCLDREDRSWHWQWNNDDLESDRIVCVLEKVKIEHDLTILNIVNVDDYDYTTVRFDDSEMIVFPDEIFAQFKNLSEVEINHSGIKKIRKNAFKNAKKIFELNLRSNDLEELTDNMFDGANSLIKLNLFSNEIRKISKQAFKSLENLKELDLSYNPIEALDEYLFYPLKNLMLIDLDHCDLKTIHSKTFSFSTQLRYISLRLNNLHELDLSFEDVNLSRLILSENELTRLNLRISGKGTLKIQNLDLENNKLSTFEIPSNINLRILDISDNQFRSLSFVLNHTRLVKLNAKNNPITKIKSEEIHSLQELKALHLDGTGVQFEKKQFFGLKKLKFLWVAKNDWQNLDVDWFQGLQNLTYLDIEKNSISEFDYKGLADTLPALKTLVLHRNLLKCVFFWEMYDYLEDKKKIDLELYYHEKVLIYRDYCETPRIFAGTPSWIILGISIPVVLACLFYEYQRKKTKTITGISYEEHDNN